jgi:hypothetical protein
VVIGVLLVELLEARHRFRRVTASRIREA